MTTDRRRRRRNTWIALAAAVVAIVATGVLGIAGVRTLADSTAGRRAGTDAIAATQDLPYTATALLGVVDESGRLTSLVDLVLDPSGSGGTIVQMAVTADASSGTTDEIRPLGMVLAADGAEALRSAASGMTGLSYDVVELADADRVRALLTPLGDLEVDLPDDIVDASSGESWASGANEVSSAAAGRLLAASDPEVADWLYEPTRAAVWSAVAAATGAGVTPEGDVAGSADQTPITLDQFTARLFAGDVAFRVLGFREIDPERVAEQLPEALETAWGEDVTAVAHDRAEMLMILGSIAPTRMGAPFDGPAFRVVSKFGPDELGDTELSESAVVKSAIDKLLFVKVNVVSVSLEPDEEAPEVTQIRVADPSVIDAVQATYVPVFGDIDVSAADVIIEGVDIEVTLGRSFLETLRTGADDVAVSGGDGTSDDSGREG